MDKQVTQAKPSLIQKMGARYNVDSDKLLSTLKNTAFRVKDGEATNEQMLALCVVADQYDLNPFTKEIYAFPDKNNGIVPVVGVDGWARIMNSHPEFDGIEFRLSESMIEMDGAKPCPEWIEAVIYRRDRKHPTVVREYLDEVYRGTIPWKSHTKRFLRHKTMIQCARIAFGFSGIFDTDEAERIAESNSGNTYDGEIVESSGLRETAPKKISVEALTSAASESPTYAQVADMIQNAQSRDEAIVASQMASFPLDMTKELGALVESKFPQSESVK